MVAPLAATVSSDRPARYRQVSWAEFPGRRAEGDSAEIGEEIQVAPYHIPG